MHVSSGEIELPNVDWLWWFPVWSLVVEAQIVHNLHNASTGIVMLLGTIYCFKLPWVFAESRNGRSSWEMLCKSACTFRLKRTCCMNIEVKFHQKKPEVCSLLHHPKFHNFSFVISTNVVFNDLKHVLEVMLLKILVKNLVTLYFTVQYLLCTFWVTTG